MRLRWKIFWAIMSAAWVTHVYACIVSNQLGLLWTGTFLPPVGWVHGIGFWFGLLN